MSEKVTYSLAHPFQFTASRRVEELSFKTRLTVGELRKISRGIETQVDALAKTICILSGEPEPLIDALDAEDYMKIQELIAPFIGNFLATGGNSAPT